MSYRGRGTLETKPSNNPFFQTTSADVGARPEQAVEWKVGGEKPPFQPSTHQVDGNFSFLYTRESDRIGARVSKPPMKEVKLLTKTEFLKKKREEFHATKNILEASGDVTHHSNTNQASPKKPTPEDLLRIYQHNSKDEDPRYTTTNVESGCCFLYRTRI